jgi:hypothetical protein
MRVQEKDSWPVDGPRPAKAAKPAPRYGAPGLDPTKEIGGFAIKPQESRRDWLTSHQRTAHPSTPGREGMQPAGDQAPARVELG